MDRSFKYLGLFLVLFALIYPSTSQAKPWCTELGVQDRFLPTLGGAAYLDKTTGLVWEKVKLSQTVGASHGAQFPQFFTENLPSAQLRCINSTVGGVGGWRLPTAEEFGSLLDATHSLPSGHPFQNGFNCDANGPFASYWTSTPALGGANYVHFSPINCGEANEDRGFFTAPSSNGNGYWCVRAPNGQ